MFLNQKKSVNWTTWTQMRRRPVSRGAEENLDQALSPSPPLVISVPGNLLDGKRAEKEKPKPGQQITNLLISLLLFPIKLLIGLLKQLGQELWSLVNLHTLVFLIIAYLLIVWVCHTIHPVGVPYFWLAGYKILLPWGQQIVKFVLKIHIV